MLLFKVINVFSKRLAYSCKHSRKWMHMEKPYMQYETHRAPNCQFVPLPYLFND